MEIHKGPSEKCGFVTKIYRFDFPLYTAQSGTWNIDFDEPIQCEDLIIVPGVFSGFTIIISVPSV